MKNITVIGSGAMGNGIAHTFAQHGFDVALTDINRESIKPRLANYNRQPRQAGKKRHV